MNAATSSETSRRSITQEYDIKAPIQAVWDAITQGEQLANWFPLEAKTEPHKGGTIWMSWKNEYVFSSTIDIYEPPGHLRCAMPFEEGKADPAMAQVAVDYFLESRPGGVTHLRLVHSGFTRDASWDALYDGTRRGWRSELGALKHYLEHHAGAKRNVIYQRAKFNGGLNEAWHMLVGAKGFGCAPAAGALAPGARTSLKGPGGKSIEAIVEYVDVGHHFVAVLPGLNKARINISCEPPCHPGAAQPEAVIFCSTYGLDAATRKAIEAAWKEVVIKATGAERVDSITT